MMTWMFVLGFHWSAVLEWLSKSEWILALNEISPSAPNCFKPAEKREQRIIHAQQQLC